MDNPRINGQDGPSQSRGGRQRPFTIQEALPFSPHTSTVPFMPDFVLEPTIGAGSPAPKCVFDPSKFNALNQEAVQAQTETTKRIRHATDAILHDLKPNMRTNFKFHTRHMNLPVTKPAESIAAGLSPFTKSVFDKVGPLFKKAGGSVDSPAPPGAPSLPISRQHPAPERQIHTSHADSPKAHPASLRTPTQYTVVQNKHPSPAEPASPSKTQVVAKENSNGTVSSESLSKPPTQPSRVEGPPVKQGVVDSNNGGKAVAISRNLTEIRKAESTPPLGQKPTLKNTLSTPEPSNIVKSSPAKSSPVKPSPVKICIELPAATFNKDEFVTVDDALLIDIPTNLSNRKRKRQDYSDSQDMLGATLDQRQKANAALRELETFAAEVNCAVDNPSGGTGALVMLSLDSEPALTAAAHQKLQTSLTKIIGLNSFDKLQLDHLLQWLKLCENTLKHCTNQDRRINTEWSQEDIESWIGELADVDHGLKAARTALRIMSGGREDKQLYSEDIIQGCIKAFRDTIDGIVVPIVELRSTSPLFKLLTPHKKAIGSLITTAQRLYAVMATVISTIELSDVALSSVGYDACKLMFVENAPFEKESIIGISKFDGIRLIAMDMLCRIFLVQPDGRQGILDDILTQLEKLPVGRQSARQFKLANGGNIQPVSALIMRLLQSSSGMVKGRMEVGQAGLDYEETSENTGPTTKKPKPLSLKSVIRSEEDGAKQHSIAIKDLKNCTELLMETAKHNASYVVSFVVNRALKATKSGDTPYRNLLDQFVEDFTICLESPDWPAAELLLRLLMVSMVKLTEGEKTAAPAKNMALELLGTMGAAISKQRSHVRRTASACRLNQSDSVGGFLSDLSLTALEQTSRVEQVVDWSGPYRVSLEHLQSHLSEDPHLTSAISFIISDWATQVFKGYEEFSTDDDGRDEELGRLAYRLRMMAEDRSWLSNEYSYQAVPAAHGRLAYSVILLRSPLFGAFNHILNILLGSMASDQATVRSRSLKSINQVLETDPSILDGDSVVVKLIFQCSGDSSTQVRDSALGLIGKCITMRPVLEEKMLPRVLERFLDNGISVRKRAMKLSRDIYLRNSDKTVRSAIANALLGRVQDPDESVRDLAKQVIEEVWFAPFYHMEKDTKYKTALADHVALIIQTVKSGNVNNILDKIFETILNPDGKTATGPFGVCAELVAHMFDLINNSDSSNPTVPAGKDALQVLMMFAKADSKLFTFEQINLLKSHLVYAPGEDLLIFRAVTVIYRRVLPDFSAPVYREFLLDVRTKLQSAIGKVHKLILDDIIACMWIVCRHLATMIENSMQPLIRMTASSLGQLGKLKARRLQDAEVNRVAMYMAIIGMVGKNCALDNEIESFKATGFFPNCKTNTVSRLMIEMLIPFNALEQPVEVRKAALEAIGLICQTNPRNYVLPTVYTIFQDVLDARNPELEAMVLKSLKEFFFSEEIRFGAASGKNKKDSKRDLKIMGGTSYDDVASATTQRFLVHIARIATATQDEHALLGAELLGSINRQGLVHPKETGVTFITLETSTNPRIAELALQEHRLLHEKHETVLEREYAKAIHSAYNYHRDVVKDSHGAMTNPFQAKLHGMIDVLKISKTKNRQRFLEKLCSQIEFDPANLDADGDLPPQVDYARFMIENLAYLEFITIGELATTVAIMEKMVATIGTGLAHIIESEMFSFRLGVDAQPDVPPARPDADTMDVDQNSDVQGDSGLMIPQPGPKMELGKLRRFTASSMILSAIWETRTYLRRLYGMGTNKQKAKAQSKDLARAPAKVQGIHGDRIWEELTTIMASLQSEQLMVERCKSFVELMSVDKELKVAEDGDMNDEDGTPSENDDRPMAVAANGTPEVPVRGRKRRASAAPPGSAKKKRGRPRKNPPPAETELADDDDAEWL